VVHVVRPFSSHRSTEIVSAPKVYGFDTGFICFHRGWSELRPEDMGMLWEHFVLNELHGQLQSRRINYWRDKRGHEIDFVLIRGKQSPAAIECKWSASDFDPLNMKAFRRQYADGKNFVVAHDIDRPSSRRFGDIQIRFVNLESLIGELGI